MPSEKIACLCSCCGITFDHVFQDGDDYEAGVDEAYCPLCLKKMLTPPDVTPVPPEPRHIAECRQIVKSKQAQGISDGVSRKTLFCDMLTANMLITVWDALKPESRAKLSALPLLKQVSICWKLVQ